MGFDDVRHDRAGRDRIRMVVAPDGAARIEFLDETGKVTQTLPTPAK